VNLPKFVNDWSDVVYRDFEKLYAIAKRSSKITGKQFERFCIDIGAEYELVDHSIGSIFEPKLVERVYRVKEYAFDSNLLAEWAREELSKQSVSVRTGATITSLHKGKAKPLRLSVVNNNMSTESVEADLVFNCTYSGLNQYNGDFVPTNTKLKHEITEMALIEVPQSLKAVGVTVMDGPFFSMMPFPSRKLHTLSHVRYTPHLSWLDSKDVNPYEKLESYEKVSRVDRMIRDVQRYMPDIGKSFYKDSLFEIKTVLEKNEGDDGRPILFERHKEVPGLYSILGGKIDNIYDVFEKLDSENF
jgi:hypothetical protein